jgi:Electron transfer DM13
MDHHFNRAVRIGGSTYVIFPSRKGMGTCRCVKRWGRDRTRRCDCCNRNVSWSSSQVRWQGHHIQDRERGSPSPHSLQNIKWPGPPCNSHCGLRWGDNENFLDKKIERIELGPLKGNEGDQNYAIPAGTDLNKFKAVSIYCVRFNANFGTAPLEK